MRCFVACFLEQQSARWLSARLPALRGFRVVPVENLHVTLKFLGSIGEDRRSDLLESVRRLEGAPTTASIREVTGFGNATRPRVVVARLTVDPRLAGWQDWLAEEWSDNETDRCFDAHVTLWRARRPGVTPPGLPELDGAEIRLQAPAAYLSETRTGGAVYRPLHNVA
jgi:2'-5' RNA ligase